MRIGGVLLSCLLLFALPATLGASQKRIAVLEFINEAGLSSFEAETLADDVREASLVLARRGYVVMTRESMLAMLPPGTDLSKCAEAQCEVDAGRQVGADLVVAGTVGRFAGDLVVRLKLFDTANAALLSQRKATGSNLKALSVSMQGAAEQLFVAVRRSDDGGSGRGTSNIEEGSIGESPEAWSFKAEDKAVVRFESDPVGAMVEVDGQPMCDATPCSKMLAPGRHSVAMKKARYGVWRETIDLRSESSVEGVLSPNFGWITVRSVPSGLSVTLNGATFGTTPIQEHEIDPGVYEVLVTDPRYYDKGERVQVAAGEHEDVNVTLLGKEGALSVAAVDPEGNAVACDVFVDGEKIGRTPWSGKLLVGEHRVQVRATDGRGAKKHVSIEAKKLQELVLPLSRVALRGAIREEGRASGTESSASKGGTWTDETTKLEWQRSWGGAMPWRDAVDYCHQNAGRLPGAGWRLPTKNELESLIDRSGRGCKWARDLGGSCTWYWSATPLEADTVHAWSVSFAHGLSNVDYVGLDEGVRCVRGGK